MNNAGVAVVKPFTEITTIEWEQTVGVNITAPFMLTQHFRFANAAGVKCCKYSFYRSQERLPNWSAYCMSKFALEGFSQCVREELRDRKIRVINVYPAATDTNIWNDVEGNWPRGKMISPKMSPARLLTRFRARLTLRWKTSLCPVSLEIFDRSWVASDVDKATRGRVALPKSAAARTGNKAAFPIDFATKCFGVR